MAEKQESKAKRYVVVAASAGCTGPSPSNLPGVQSRACGQNGDMPCVRSHRHPVEVIMLFTIGLLTIGCLIYGLGMIEDVPKDPEIRYRDFDDDLGR